MIPYRFFNQPSLDLQSFFDEFYNLRNVLEKRFQGEMGKDQILFRNRVRPPVNIFETPDLFVIRAQVPGLKKDDINLAVTGNSITLSHEKKEENDPKERIYNRRERNLKSFNRLIRLPS